MSRRLVLENRKTAIRVLCPGPVNSNIAREAPGWMQPLLKGVFSIFFKSHQKASDPIIYFANEAIEDSKPLAYLFLMQQKEMNEKAMNVENGKKLWALIEGLIKKLGIELN